MAVDVVIGGCSMDLTSDAGFVGALYHTCRLAPGSGWLAAPVCSSFVYMYLDLNYLQTCCMLVYLTINEAKGKTTKSIPIVPLYSFMCQSKVSRNNKEVTNPSSGRRKLPECGFRKFALMQNFGDTVRGTGFKMFLDLGTAQGLINGGPSIIWGNDEDDWCVEALHPNEKFWGSERQANMVVQQILSSISWEVLDSFSTLVKLIWPKAEWIS